MKTVRLCVLLLLAAGVVSAQGEQKDPTPDALKRDPRTLRRTRDLLRQAPTWELWWSLNRAAYVNLRERYHERFVVTPFGRRRGGSGRPRRPSHHEVVLKVLPGLKLAAQKGDVTALLAWASCVGPNEREAAAGAILEYLAKKDNPWRELALLALGVTQEEGGFDPLLDLALDESQPERLRAAAVAALGAMGDADAIEHLVELLEKERKTHADLRSAAVVTLGLLAPGADQKTRTQLGAFLLDQLKRGRWPREALAAIPTAMARAGHWEKLVDRLGQGAAKLRQSTALALGLGVPKLTIGLAQALQTAALEDTDPMVRGFAALALGEISHRSVNRTDEQLMDALLRFFGDALRGSCKQPGDRPWQCLGAALFARRFEEHGDLFVDRLLKVARSGARASRAAAVVGLGLLGNRRSLDGLRALFRRARDETLRAYLAEALGMLRDRSAKKGLLALATTDKSRKVSYHAALGVGFLADSTALEPLAQRAALAGVVGEIGDRASVAALFELAKSHPKALAALGALGRQADVSWQHAFGRGYNFTLPTPTLRLLLALP